jgi:hypothetical protein
MPARRSCSAPIRVRLPISLTSVGQMVTIFYALVPGLRQCLFDGGIIARAAQHFGPDIAGEGRTRSEQADTVVPIVPVGAGDRRYCLRLVDRAEQRTPLPLMLSSGPSPPPAAA